MNENENMPLYVGTKVIKARPMNRGDYNAYRGWTLPEDENGADEGFLVEYTDGGQANHANHAGYISWSPRAVFENAYQPPGRMSFGAALQLLEAGLTVARAGWNGAGQFVFKIQGSNDIAKLHGYGFGEMLNEPTFADAMFLRNTANQLVPWTPSQGDCFAKDWTVVA